MHTPKIQVTRNPFKVVVQDHSELKHTAAVAPQGKKGFPAPKKEKPFVYVSGDKTKTPIDPKTQKMGTKLIQVTPKGRDVPITVGKRSTKSLADRTASLAKRKKSDKKADG